MTELTDREARQLAGAMRPHRKPLWIAFGANVILAIALLGVPYVRGRMLAQAERADFVAFARCMIGGEPASEPGLSLPRGEREHYAAKVLYANSDWPLSCRPLLKRLQPPDATFLWPSVKVAGADLRAAVELVDRELVSLAKRRTQAPGRVPQRPLDAIQRLQAASVLFARASNVSRHVDNDALLLSPNLPSLPSPARLPLMIGESQGMAAWSESGILQVLALDAHSLAYLRVENGKVDRQRARKKAFLRGVVRAGDTPYLVWAMPESRCAEREDGCVGRPTGLSRFDKGTTELGEPSWRLEGHPAVRLDRALRVSELGRVDLLVRSSKDGGINLLRARLPIENPGAVEKKPTWLEPEVISIVPPLPASAPPPPSAASSATPPTGADPSRDAPASSPVAANAAPGSASPASGVTTGASGALDGAAAAVPSAPARRVSAMLVADEPLSILRTLDAADGVDAALVVVAHSAQTFTLPTAAGSGGWVAACSAETVRWLAYGSASELRLVRAQGTTLLPIATQSAQLGEPIDPSDGARDRLVLSCTEQLLRVLFVDDKRVLRQITCGETGCGAASELAPVVQQLSAVQRQDVTIVSYYEGPLAPTIKLLRLDAQGRPVGPAVVAGSCWEPLGGLCGTASLIGDAQRVALLARDGPDLLALESANTGRSWSTLSGFQQRAAPNSGSSAPMQQHRQRKGLEE